MDKTIIMNKMRVNVVVLNSALETCSEYSNLWIGKQIHCVALRFGFTYDTNYVMLCMQSVGIF